MTNLPPSDGLENNVTPARVPGRWDPAVPVVPSLHQKRGPKWRHLDHAIRTALREYETSRGREVDFTLEHISHFRETVLATWSESILTTGEMGS